MVILSEGALGVIDSAAATTHTPPTTQPPAAYISHTHLVPAVGHQFLVPRQAVARLPWQLAVGRHVGALALHDGREHDLVFLFLCACACVCCGFFEGV